VSSLMLLIHDEFGGSINSLKVGRLSSN
jgi:hypothetical protein